MPLLRSSRRCVPLWVAVVVAGTFVVLCGLSARFVIEWLKPENPIIAKLRLAKSFRVHSADEIIALNVDEPDGIAAMALLREWLNMPCDALLIYNSGWSTRVDLLDSSGNEVMAMEVDGGHLIVGEKHFCSYDTSAFMTIFETRYAQKTYYYSNGSRRSDGIHDHGQKHGLWTYYYPNGAKMSEGQYQWGRKTGQWIEWNEDGRITRQDDYP